MSYPAPHRVVWELTWRCNLRCSHCLVEGGPNDKDELRPEEALDLVDQIATLGVRQLTLTGGEPLLRRDWAALLARAGERGLRTALSSNGHAIHENQARKLADLGVADVALSLDGLPVTHDALRVYPEARARRSSFQDVAKAIGCLRAVGVPVQIITTARPDNLHELPELHGVLKTLGVSSWMVQLAHATGRLGAPAMLSPARMPELARFLVQAAEDEVLPPIVHTSIGWLSADEPVLRQSGRASTKAIWAGPVCGRTVMGVEPDGGVKGCPNQVGAPFVVGQLRQESLDAIWNDRRRWFWVEPHVDTAQGACTPCGLKRHCKGGCPCIAFASTGHTFDNPLCLRAVARG